MKRTMAETSDLDRITMANCLMLLSRSSDSSDSISDSPNRVFECKTCNRTFASFQALGGHRASHKKPRLINGDAGSSFEIQLQSSPAKPKSHECSICGLEFAIGQALGGHMRRHRVTVSDENRRTVTKSSERRVYLLDLNLTPYENDLEFRFGKRSAIVDCFL